MHWKGTGDREVRSSEGRLVGVGKTIRGGYCRLQLPLGGTIRDRESVAPGSQARPT